MNMTDDRRVLMGVGAAIEASTEAGRKRNGWVRLGRVRSLSEPKAGEKREVYVLAARALTGSKAYQLGCSCPDWIHRKSHTGEPCKHQALFLAHEGGSSPRKGVWLYRAGRAFLRLAQGK